MPDGTAQVRRSAYPNGVSMLKARIIEILSRDSSDMHRIERVANELELLFIEELADCLVSILVKLYQGDLDE